MNKDIPPLYSDIHKLYMNKVQEEPNIAQDILEHMKICKLIIINLLAHD